MQAQEIKQRLQSLVQEASIIDPNLAKRLGEINRWVKNVKPGLLTAKPFLSLFLLQIILDADAWLKFKTLASADEQQAAINALNPTVRYWYSDLFPKWLSEHDPKFYIWKQKLMAGEFSHQDQNLIKSIAHNINQRNAGIVQRYIADLSMATDIIISSQQEKPLCIQLTSLADEYSQQKVDDWKMSLRFWGVERGLFLSYNPNVDDFVNRIVNISLHNSDHLHNGIYLKFNV
ncbi:hypothetical protein NIES4101_77190 [Calothrix sp. NIES-4101]|nr:hypothetical protein NIES4101_77190 [Calothrix sp. NIES-4101]